MSTFNKPKDNIPSVKTAINSMPPSNIRLQGYLMKQKHGRCRAWLRRYFVLYDEEIRYYKTKVKNKTRQNEKVKSRMNTYAQFRTMSNV